MTTAKTALLMIGIAIMADNFLSAKICSRQSVILFPDRQVGRATGLMGVASGLSGLLFPLLTGSLVDHSSYTPVFLLVGFMPLIGTISLFLFGRDYRFKRKSLNLARSPKTEEE